MPCPRGALTDALAVLRLADSRCVAPLQLIRELLLHFRHLAPRVPGSRWRGEVPAQIPQNRSERLRVTPNHLAIIQDTPGTSTVPSRYLLLALLLLGLLHEALVRHKLPQHLLLLELLALALHDALRLPVAGEDLVLPDLPRRGAKTAGDALTRFHAPGNASKR